MRQAFAHDAVLVMEPGADERAPGAAVTLALCGDLDHEPPCPLAPHHVRVGQVADGLRVRVLFAAEPEAEPEVRRRIQLALSGRWPFPEGFTTAWLLRASAPSEVSPDERDHAQRLVHN